MDPVNAFNERLRSLTGNAIRELATALRHEVDTAEGELAWWRATIAVSAELKRKHCTRQAGLAAHHASVALLEAAQRAGIAETAREDVTVVARAASEVARALVASTAPVLPTPWRPLVPVAA
jgi:hypothetical protein